MGRFGIRGFIVGGMISEARYSRVTHCDTTGYSALPGLARVLGPR